MARAEAMARPVQMGGNGAPAAATLTSAVTAAAAVAPAVTAPSHLGQVGGNCQLHHIVPFHNDLDSFNFIKSVIRWAF
jgi:hypothetical protein